MHIYNREQIENAIDMAHLMAEIEQGLILYSKKKTLTAPSSFLHFTMPPGDVHIKSGAIIDEPFFVIKIASGFYDNPKLKLPSSNGLVLLFSQKTGVLKAVLLDEGRLTDLRTGLAGAIAAKYLANHPITKIGIIGTGTQAKEQLLALQHVTECRDVLVWGRNPIKAVAFAQQVGLSFFDISVADNLEDVVQSCPLIITATASTEPLIFGSQLRPGTHITAVGADGYGKQELDGSVMDRADLIIVDSLSQCLEYGDLAHAKGIKDKSIIELGAFIEEPRARAKTSITVADLTGVAVEDLQVAKSVFYRLKSIYGIGCMTGNLESPLSWCLE